MGGYGGGGGRGWDRVEWLNVCDDIIGRGRGQGVVCGSNRDDLPVLARGKKKYFADERLGVRGGPGVFSRWGWSMERFKGRGLSLCNGSDIFEEAIGFGKGCLREQMLSNFYYYRYGTGIAEKGCAVAGECADDFSCALGVGGVSTGCGFALDGCGEDSCLQECVES